MTPILGIMASQISGHLVTNSYESISTQTISSNTTSVTFSSIPSTYKHLQIRALLQSNRATYPSTDLFIQLGNGSADTGANYSTHRLAGNGASASAVAPSTPGGSYINFYDSVSSTVASNIFAALVIDVLDYQNSNKYKTVRSLNGIDLNGTVAGVPGTVALQSGLWQSTSVVNTIKFSIYGGDSFTQYSSFALYGIKG